MIDALVATVVVVLAVAVALGALAAVTVVPFVVALQRGDALAASSARVGALALAGIATGLLLAALLVLGGSSPVVALAPLLLAWAVPALLQVVERAPPWLGTTGRHEGGGLSPTRSGPPASRRSARTSRSPRSG